MLIIAINTASSAAERKSAIALIEMGKVLGEESWYSNRNESERILPGLDRLLKENGKSWDDVGGVFVVKGPGSYTSLRVGITIANTIAWVRKIPMWTTDLGLMETVGHTSSMAFARTVSSLNFAQLEKTDCVEPLYAAPPKITPRKK